MQILVKLIKGMLIIAMCIILALPTVAYASERKYKASCTITNNNTSDQSCKLLNADECPDHKYLRNVQLILDAQNSTTCKIGRKIASKEDKPCTNSQLSFYQIYPGQPKKFNYTSDNEFCQPESGDLEYKNVELFYSPENSESAKECEVFAILTTYE